MSAIIVRGENQRLVGQREQLAGDRIVLSAGVAAREIGAPGTVDEEDIAGENAILGENADRVRRVAGSMQHADILVAELERLAVLNMNSDVRRRRQKMHGDGGVRQRAQ